MRRTRNYSIRFGKHFFEKFKQQEGEMTPQEIVDFLVAVYESNLAVNRAVLLVSERIDKLAEKVATQPIKTTEPQPERTTLKSFLSTKD